jgi:sulfite exporter TauE/SafE
MATAILQGWLLGLSTGAYCLGLCAPALLPYLVSCGTTNLRALGRLVAEFLAGRLVAYLLLGLLAVLLGTELQTWPGTRPVAGLLTILLALLLLAHGLRQNFPGLVVRHESAVSHGATPGPDYKQWICAVLRGSSALRRVPFVAGLALGLSPCPPLLLGLTALLTKVASPLPPLGEGLGVRATGLAFLVAFFAGTTVWLVPFVGAGSLARSSRLRGVAEVAVLFSGMWFLIQGACLLRG